MSRAAYILNGMRTPVMPRGGAFGRLDVHELAAPVMQACLKRAGFEGKQLDQIVMGNALYGGGNPARRALLQAGLPMNLSGITIDTQCSSGIDAILLARDMVLSGQADLVLAGGAESYSRRPLRLVTDPSGAPPVAYDQPPFTPWPARDPLMHEAAAALADRFGIDRKAQEHWAIKSHAKALAAANAMTRELVDPGQTNPRLDGFSRRLSQKLCDRAPVVAGTITNATAAVGADAAAFLLVGSEQMARKQDGAALRITAGASLGGDPEWPGLAPVDAVKQVLENAGCRPSELSCAEIMEAYAVQAMICVDQTGLDPDIVNIGGGALARGHPTGASGTILVVRLLHELQRSGGKGIAAIAAAGGIGSALLLDRE